MSGEKDRIEKFLITFDLWLNDDARHELIMLCSSFYQEGIADTQAEGRGNDNETSQGSNPRNCSRTQRESYSSQAEEAMTFEEWLNSPQWSNKKPSYQDAWQAALKVGAEAQQERDAVRGRIAQLENRLVDEAIRSASIEGEP